MGDHKKLTRLVVGGVVGALIGAGAVHLGDVWKKNQSGVIDLGYQWTYIKSQPSLFKAFGQLSMYREADESLYKRIGDFTDTLCSLATILSEGNTQRKPKLNWMYSNMRLYTAIQDLVDQFDRKAVEWLMVKRPLQIDPRTRQMADHDPLSVTDLKEAKEVFLGLVSDVHYHNSQIFNLVLKGINQPHVTQNNGRGKPGANLGQAIGMMGQLLRNFT